MLRTLPTQYIPTVQLTQWDGYCEHEDISDFWTLRGLPVAPEAQGYILRMDFCEVTISPPPRFTHAGVAHGLPGYVHPHRPSLDIPEVFIVERGRLFIEDNGRRVAARRGDVLFHPAGVCQHGYRPSKNGVTFVWVHFEAAVAPRRLGAGEADRIRESVLHAQHLPARRESPIVIPRHHSPSTFADILDLGYKLAERTPRLAAERSALVVLLLSRLSVGCFAASSETQSGPHARTVERIKYWVDKNVDRPVTVADIAGRMRLNADYMNRLFRRHTGLSVRSYVRLRKVETSKRLLAAGMSVKEAAARCGFGDPAYFARKFRSFTGISPSQFAQAAGDYRRN
jgi:AraC-like DNA-binding protein